MASVAPSFSSTKERTNYARLCRLLVDVGTQVVRDTFDRIHPPSCLHWILAGKLPTLQSLRKRKILNVTQWGRLFPAISSSVSSASFDITLLVVLLRNICGLSAPASTGSWDILPHASDNSIEANIARIKYYRNNVYGHATQASVDEPTFQALWLEISNALLALGSAASYTSAISRLKTDCMDPDVEERYRELLKEWKKDDDSTKDKLEQLEEMLKTQGVHTQDQLKEIQEMQKTQGVHTQDKLKEFQETVIRKLETHEVHSQGKLKVCLLAGKRLCTY
ncbi:E3 ubiquitin-protein ligase DZIP3-like [Montipora foliosa]|uniref:E3 ubiquitin-protein ligase DZIP3-like n=1 Tax=Montipora foliosa TaxID=591990 RepID=UPI0035F1168D